MFVQGLDRISYRLKNGSVNRRPIFYFHATIQKRANMKKEVWKPAKGKYGYDVSSYGRVKDPRGQILTPYIGTDGEIKVEIVKNEENVFEIVTNTFLSKDVCPQKKECGPERKPVLQIEPSTSRIVHEFKSLREASRLTGINPSTISKACNNFNRVSQGYRWEFA